MKRLKQRLIDGRIYQLATFSYKKSTIESLAKHYKNKAYFRIVPGKKKGKTVYYFYLGKNLPYYKDQKEYIQHQTDDIKVSTVYKNVLEQQLKEETNPDRISYLKDKIKHENANIDMLASYKQTLEQDLKKNPHTETLEYALKHGQLRATENVIGDFHIEKFENGCWNGLGTIDSRKLASNMLNKKMRDLDEDEMSEWEGIPLETRKEHAIKLFLKNRK